ncbi:NADP-dependent oxidoreductase [Gracilimonas mengyeensis]|uniref:NADPH:quinone reductase n=1 Tax=Gracilimonas mengyeensis TaxID=1302730 RepID=A0A521DH39_9BACT|nr:NADP-dependent oxidoreductase [Gracilimonas mengyeensis]SMO70892.1 NADPH:quinone reductase [Gracilimonas mengyeensis]
MSEQMKAAYYDEYGELDQVKTGELDKPEAGEGEVLIRVKAAGVNPVDAAVARGMLDSAIPGEFPAIPGWDVAGVIEGRGHAARRFEEGDEVYAYARRPKVQHGTFAEYVALPEAYVAKRPQKISMEEAGGIPLVGLTAYQSLFDAGKLEEGQTVLILGASGGVGTSGIQLAKSAGANVIGVASEKNHEYMKELGADETIDYKDNHVGEALAEIEPDGVDLIFHCSRGDAFSQVMETGVLKDGGHIVSITKSKPDISDDINFQYVFVEPNAAQLDKLTEIADDGKLEVHVSKTYNLDEAADALKDIESLHTRGKLIVTP